MTQLKTRRSIIAACIVGVLLIASGAFAVNRLRSSPIRGPQTPAERVAMLDNSLRAIEDAERLSPRDRWDPDYVVAQVGRDQHTLAEWVRNNTPWIPYHGVLRGPVGVLMDRQGNSLDRTLLLATLLEKAGHHVRLAHAQLTRNQALDLLPELVITNSVRTEPSAASDPAPDQIEAVAAQYDLDPNAIKENNRRQEEGVSRLFAELHARVLDQTTRLSAEVERPDPTKDWTRRFEKAIAAARDHWWVQVDRGSTWADVEIVDLKSLTADRVMAISEIDAHLHHELVVRVVAEHWSDGGVRDTLVLEHMLRPSDIIGQQIALQFSPARWPKELASDPTSELGLKGQALAQTSWSAALVVGGNVVTQAVLAGRGAPKRTGPAIFGGLGGAVASAVAGPEEGVKEEISGAWIEYEIRSPGDSTRVIRRAIFDLFGPAARAEHQTSSLVMDEKKKLTRSLALMMRTEILPVTSRLAPEFVRHLAMQSILANSRALRLGAQILSSPDSVDGDSLIANAAEGITPLYPLAVARMELSSFRDHIYLDRINVLTRHRHAGVLDDGFAIRGSVEVIAREIGVSLGVPDAFVVRQEQGVLDTSAEALWWTGDGINNTGEAYKLSSDWRTFTPASAGDVDESSLSADARAQVRADLAAGLVVIAPAHPVEIGPDRFVGWWRIDPETGTTQGTPANGWGQCGAESSVHWRVAVQGIKTMAFEYWLCQGIAQMANGMRAWAKFVQSRGWFWWAPPAADPSDPKKVLKDANKACLFSAMMSGVLVTLPLVMITADRWAAAGLAEVATPYLKPANVGRGYTQRIPRGAIKPITPKGEPGSPRPPTDPFENTQDLSKGPPPERKPPPKNPTPEDVKQYRERFENAKIESKKAFDDVMDYSRKNPANMGDEDFDHETWKKITDKMMNADDEAILARRDMDAIDKALNDRLAAGRRRPGQGGFGPPRPKAAPPSPNDLAKVGANGAENSFYPFKWPDGK